MSDFDPSEFEDYDTPQAPQAYTPPAAGFPQQYGQAATMPDFTFNFDEANEPTTRTAIPAGPYPISVVDFNIRYVGKDPNRQWTVVTFSLLVENSNTQYEGTVLEDDWFMPNRGLQEEKKYRDALGRMKQRMQTVFGRPITGTETLVPANLIGKRAIVDVIQTRDKIDGQLDAQGKQAYYDPRNRVRPVWHPYSASPVSMAQVFPIVPPAPSAPPAPPLPVAPVAPSAAPVAPVAPQPPTQPVVPLAPPTPQTAPQAPLTASTPESTPSTVDFEIPDFDL